MDNESDKKANEKDFLSKGPQNAQNFFNKRGGTVHLLGNPSSF